MFKFRTSHSQAIPKKGFSQVSNYEKYKNHPALNPPVFYNPSTIEKIRDFFIQYKVQNNFFIPNKKDNPFVIIFLFFIAFVFCCSLSFFIWNIFNKEQKQDYLPAFTSKTILDNKQFINYLNNEQQFLLDERKYKIHSPYLFTSYDNPGNDEFYIRNADYFEKVISLSISSDVSEDESSILRQAAASYASDLLKAQQELSSK